jgi:hypothetical protein
VVKLLDEVLNLIEHITDEQWDKYIKRGEDING